MTTSPMWGSKAGSELTPAKATEELAECQDCTKPCHTRASTTKARDFGSQTSEQLALLAATVVRQGNSRTDMPAFEHGIHATGSTGHFAKVPLPLLQFMRR